MALTGRLEEMGAAEILQLISLARKSGKLVLSDGQRQGVVVFNDGRIVFAASESLRDTVGSTLLSQHLFPRERFVAEARDPAAAKTESGSFIVHVREAEPGRLEALVREQIEKVVRELLTWRSGGFTFDVVDVPDPHDLALDAGGFALEAGVSAEEVLLETLTKLDEQDRASWERDLRAAAEGSSAYAEERAGASDISGAFEVLIDEHTGEVSWAPRPDASRNLADLRQLVDEMFAMKGMSPTLTADVTLLVLRYAAQVVNRGVLFAVRAEEFQGIGQFGLPTGKPGADHRVSRLRIPRREPSVLAQAAAGGATVRGRLQSTRWNDFLVAHLGGGVPREVIAMPMVIEGSPVAIFYGDNLPEVTSLGAVDGLEILMREVTLAVERARLQQRLQVFEAVR